MEKTVITPSGTSLWGYLRDMRRYHRILYAFTYRSIRGKYAQTLMGFLWVIINPLISLIILGFVFGKVAKLDTQGVDPFLYTMIGLVGWTYFANVVSAAGGNMIGASNMIKKIFFPRIFIPLSVVATALIELVVLIGLMLILLLLNQYWPSKNIVFYPLVLLLIVLLTAGVSFFLGAAVVRYRDFQQVVPFLTRIGLYATPVAYGLHVVDVKYRFLFNLNPMTGLMEGSRWCFFGGIFPGEALSISLIWTVVFWVMGLLYFNRVEKTMADLI